LADTATAVATNGNETCALTNGGALKCWGLTDINAFGDGLSNVPVNVTGLGAGVVAIATGNSGLTACALTSAGAVKCWGQNSSGVLGDGTAKNSSTPVNVTSLGSGVAAITVGVNHVCALMSAGIVKCWGDNYYGELGNGTSNDSFTPVNVTSLGSEVLAIATSGWHSCALTSAGSVECWGENYYGQLGNGTTTDSSIPVNVTVPVAVL